MFDLLVYEYTCLSVFDFSSSWNETLDIKQLDKSLRSWQYLTCDYEHLSMESALQFDIVGSQKSDRQPARIKKI